jgi:membrane associated rhomboid family serine protease
MEVHHADFPSRRCYALVQQFARSDNDWLGSLGRYKHCELCFVVFPIWVSGRICTRLMTDMCSAYSFGGILFSCVCSDTLSVGASTAVYGMVGAYLAFLILNWDYLKSNTNRRFQIMVFLFMSLILSIIFTSNSDNIDVLGHLGGFLSGSLLGLFLLPGLIRN